MPTKLDRDDVDLVLLGTEIGERLSRPVTLSARPPGQLDDDGQPLDGVLIVLDPDTGEELDVDGRTVTAAIKAHVKPPEQEELKRAERTKALDDAEAKVTAGDTAGALADLFAMLRADTTPTAADPAPADPAPAPAQTRRTSTRKK